MQSASSDLRQQPMAMPYASSLLPRYAVPQQDHSLAQSSCGPSAVGSSGPSGNSGAGGGFNLGHASAEQYDFATPWSAAAPTAGFAASAAAQHFQQRTQLQQAHAWVLDLSLPDEAAYRSSALSEATQSSCRPAAVDGTGNVQQPQHARHMAAGLSSTDNPCTTDTACPGITQAPTATAAAAVLAAASYHPSSARLMAPHSTGLGTHL